MKFLLTLFLLLSTSVFADDHGSGLSTATTVGSSSSTTGVLEIGGDNDYFKIILPSSGTLTINSTGALDMFGYLLDVNGVALANDDDSGAGTNFLMSRNVTAGTYYIRVRAYSATVTGNYLLVIDFLSNGSSVISSDDHGSGLSTATAVSVSSATPGIFEVGGDNDYFKVMVPTTGTLTINSTGAIDMFGYLYSSSGIAIANDDDSGAGTNFLMAKNLSAGTYYVRVRAYSATVTGNYSLVINLNTNPRQEVVLLLHGLGSSADTWNDLVRSEFANSCQALRSTTPVVTASSSIRTCYRVNFGSYDTDIVFGETGLEGRKCNAVGGCKGDYSSFITLGKELKGIVHNILQAYSYNADVILLGHSRGGLAARAFLQNTISSAEKESVVGLITTGTPHYGSPFGRFYHYMKDVNTCSPKAKHTNNNPFINADCEDDWELVDLVTFTGQLDFYSPAIGYFSPESTEISNIISGANNLPNIEYKQMVYKGVGLGVIRYFGFNLWNLFSSAGGIGHPTQNGIDSVLNGYTIYNYGGDGIVPRYYQGFGKSEFLSTVSAGHLEETSRVSDLQTQLRQMYFNLNW